MVSDAASWDALADGFDKEPDHGLRDPATRRAWMDLLLEKLPPAPARVADIGCGTGTISTLLAGCGYRVAGADFSPQMIRLAEAKSAAAGLDVDFVVADAASLPWSGGSFDCVFARHVLWAVTDPALALNHWLSLLCKGASMVLVEGRWSTGVGLRSPEALRLLHTARRADTVVPLDDPKLWGGPITDERYLIVSCPA